MSAKNIFVLFSAFLVISITRAAITAVPSSEPLPGGPNWASQETIKQLEEKIAEDLEKLKGQADGAHYELVKVHKAIERVVAGFIWETETELSSPKTNEKEVCDIVVFEQAWLNFRETNVTCGEKKFQVVKGERAKRQVFGGLGEITSEKGLQDIENKVRNHLEVLQKQENGEKLQLKKIKRARSQVVAGFKYYVDVELASESGESRDCTITILEAFQSTTEDSEITCGEKTYKVSARQQRSKRQLQPVAGGKIEITSTKELNEVKTRVTAALTKLSEQDGGAKLELKELKKATRQTVAGSLYSVEAVLASPEETKTCTITILIQGWLDNEETEINCEDKTYKVTKSITQV